MTRRQARGLMTLLRDGRELASGVAVVQLTRQQDGALCLEIADDITDGQICRILAEIDPPDVERALAEVSGGATTVAADAVVATSAREDGVPARGRVQARLPSDRQGDVELLASLGEIAIHVSAPGRELVGAIVDLLPLAGGPRHRHES